MLSGVIGRINPTRLRGNNEVVVCFEENLSRFPIGAGWLGIDATFGSQGNIAASAIIMALWCKIDAMVDKNPAAVELGRKGGLARARAMTANERRRIAIKASKAAARARTAAARARRQANRATGNEK